MIVVAVVVLCVLVAIGLALALRRWRPVWAPWRRAAAAGAVVPALVLAGCGWIAVDVALTPAAQCGVDACAMAIAGVVFIASAAVAVWAVGTVAAGLTVRGHG